jgi:hypothetical protein
VCFVDAKCRSNVNFAARGIAAESATAKALNGIVDEALASMPSKKLCWCEGGGNKIPVVVRVRGKRGLQWTATGKQLVSIIIEWYDQQHGTRPAVQGYNSYMQRKRAVFDAALKSKLQSKLCKRL